MGMAEMEGRVKLLLDLGLALNTDDMAALDKAA